MMQQHLNFNKFFLAACKRMQVCSLKIADRYAFADRKPAEGLSGRSTGCKCHLGKGCEHEPEISAKPPAIFQPQKSAHVLQRSASEEMLISTRHCLFVAFTEIKEGHHAGFAEIMCQAL